MASEKKTRVPAKKRSVSSPAGKTKKAVALVKPSKKKVAVTKSPVKKATAVVKAEKKRPSAKTGVSGKKPAGKALPSRKKTASLKSTVARKVEKKTAKKPVLTRKVEKKIARLPESRQKVLKEAEKTGGRLHELKKALLQRRQAILSEAKQEIAKYISGENRQLVDTALDEGDWAVVDISEDINLMRLGAHRKAMLDIDEALRKIAEGTYGVCEECGEDISERRLNVIPAATLCINCQENKEQIESIRLEEIS